MRMLKFSGKQMAVVGVLAGLLLPQVGRAQPFRARIGGFGGGIGLQPVVRYVPTGSVFDATATVSHDRRYVTITARPQSSHLINMHSLPVDLIGGIGGGAGGAALAAGPGAGAGAKKKPARPPAMKGKYAAMAHAALVGPRQRTAMAKIAQVKEDAELQWDLANGAQLCQYQYQKADAATASAKAGAGRQARTLLARRDRLSAGYHKQILAVLLPQQRAKAAGSLLGTFFCDDLAAVGLGYRQKAKIRAICGTAAKTHFADTDITRDEAVKAKCLDEIRRDVLTQAQRDRHGRATPPR